MQTKVSAETIGEMTAKIRAHTGAAHRRGIRHFQSRSGRAVAASAEAVVVGSAIVNQIAKYGRSPDMTAQASPVHRRSLVQAAKGRFKHLEQRE
jgi:tryptophan synthase alpha subunit